MAALSSTGKRFWFIKSETSLPEGAVPDPHLHPDGVMRCLATARNHGISPNIILCSPLQRAMGTASLLFGERSTIVPIPLLKDMKGAGTNADVLQERYPTIVVPPLEPSWWVAINERSDRVAALRSLLIERKEREIAVVSHPDILHELCGVSFAFSMMVPYNLVDEKFVIASNIAPIVAPVLSLMHGDGLPPLFDDAIYFPGVDSFGNDVGHHPGKKMGEMDRLVEIGAWNTSGYHKSCISVDLLRPFGSTYLEGLYVKKLVTKDKTIPTIIHSNVSGEVKGWTVMVSDNPIKTLCIQGGVLMMGRIVEIPEWLLHLEGGWVSFVNERKRKGIFNRSIIGVQPGSGFAEALLNVGILNLDSIVGSIYGNKPLTVLPSYYFPTIECDILHPMLLMSVHSPPKTPLRLVSTPVV